MSYKNIGIIGLRALNDYRYQDALSFYSISKYLETCDDWSDSSLSKRAIQDAEGSIFFRYSRVGEIRFSASSGQTYYSLRQSPAAELCILESLLLNYCSEQSAEFSLPDVYRNRLARPESRISSFENFGRGSGEMWRKIEEACNDKSNLRVRQFDIKKFYPSLSLAHCKTSWQAFCRTYQFDDQHRHLGDLLLESQSAGDGVGSSSLRSGPLFSDFISGVVLSELDHYIAQNQSVPYFRYGDDFTLVGNSQETEKATAQIERWLERYGLSIHPRQSPKHKEFSSEEWLLKSKILSTQASHSSWGKFSKSLHFYLARFPFWKEALFADLQKEGFRIPQLDFSKALDPLKTVPKTLSFLISSTHLRSKHAIVKLALELRKEYSQRLIERLEELADIDFDARGFHILKIRFLVSRLCYLAHPSELALFYRMLDGIEELQSYREIFLALDSGIIDGVLPLGHNVAQACAQLFYTASMKATITKIELSEAESHSALFFPLNGVALNTIERNASKINATLKKYSSTITTPPLSEADLTHSFSFIQEIGIDSHLGNPEFFTSVYDESQSFVFDTIAQL